MNKINIIPIMVKKGNSVNTWYMDISKMSLSELLYLRENLKGTMSNTIAAIDSSVINGKYVLDCGYNKLQNTYKRETRKNNAKIRDLSHKYHRRKND